MINQEQSTSPVGHIAVAGFVFFKKGQFEFSEINLVANQSSALITMSMSIFWNPEEVGTKNECQGPGTFCLNMSRVQLTA